MRALACTSSICFILYLPIPLCFESGRSRCENTQALVEVSADLTDQASQKMNLI